MGNQPVPATNSLQGFLDSHFPKVPGLTLKAGPVDDHRQQLLPEERPAIENAVAKRQYEFSTGRLLARSAMAQLGIGASAVARDPERRPIWPDNALGSISHTGKLALAAVAHRQALRGVGVDLEEGERVVPQLHAKLFTPRELTVYAQSDPRWTGLLFSAKEAGYKAANPIVGKFIGFQEVEIDVDWQQWRFAIRYVGEHTANQVLDLGWGHFGFFADHVITLFVIP
jgi:4'-phosphopantetheinyl transferase EntD